MTTNTQELQARAQALLENGKLRWAPGMFTLDALIVSVDDAGHPTEVVFDGRLMSVGDDDDSYDLTGACPYLDHDGTLGLIAGQIPKVWGGDCDVDINTVDDDDGQRALQVLVARDGEFLCYTHAPTLAEALLAALEAAP